MSSDGEFLKTAISPSGSKLYRGLGKRVFDIALTLLALPIVLPLIGFLALLVACDGGKPFYGQDRIGKGGRIYRQWKLRSMAKDVDDLRHERDSRQKPVNGPHITGLGRFLSASSLDELPQVFNVLIGDMSLVGPQPMMVSQKALSPGEDDDDLRPGITGLWQISDQHRLTSAERMDCDARYKRILSLASDVMILAATVKIGLRNRGR